MKHFLFVFLILLCGTKCLEIYISENEKGSIQSVFISFGEAERLNFIFNRGVLQYVDLTSSQNCEIPEGVSHIVGDIALLRINDVERVCTNPEKFYNLIQSAHFNAIVISTYTLYSSGSPLLFPKHMNTSSFSIPITAITDKDLERLIQIVPINATISNDQGFFYHLTHHPGFIFYGYATSVVLGCLSIYPLVRLIVEIRKKGFTSNISVFVFSYLFLFCLGRAIYLSSSWKIEFYTEDYSKDKVYPIYTALFWISYLSGIAVYSHASFHWLSLIRLKSTAIIEKPEKFLQYFFLILVPFSGTCILIIRYLAHISFLIDLFFLGTCISIFATFEAVLFTYCGWKFMKISKSSIQKSQNEYRVTLYRKIVLFIFGSAIAWFLGAIFAVFFIVVLTLPNANLMIFIISVIRELLGIFFVFFIVLAFKTQNPGQKRSQDTSDTQTEI